MYRTTATRDYQRCPAYWWHKESGLTPQEWGKGEVSAALGVAIHHGTAKLDECNGEEGLEDRIRRAITQSKDVFEHELAQYLGEPSTKVARELIEKAPRYIENMVRVYGEENPIDAAGLDILAVEKKYLASTIDRVVRDRETGEVGILDLKTKMFDTNPDYWRAQFLREFATSWQLRQYSYEYTAATGEPVNEFYLMLGETKKKRYSIHPYQLSDSELEKWHRSARQIWADMAAVEAGEREPYRVDDHRMFGKQCPFYRTCFQGWDENVYTNIKSAYE